MSKRRSLPPHPSEWLVSEGEGRGVGDHHIVSAPEIRVSVTERTDLKLTHRKRLPTRTLPIRKEEEDQIGTPGWVNVDAQALERDLLSVVKGEVRFDGATRAMYGHDASNYRMLPLGVVIPRDKQDVANTVALARKHGCPIHFRGGGTSIPGQGINAGLMIDFAKYMNAILEIDPEKRLARVQPGVVLDELRHAAEKHGLTFGPDPATHSRCTLGGMIGNNSCGTHSVMAGRTADNVESLEVLLYDGTILNVGPTNEQELEERISKGGREGEIFWKLKTLRGTHATEIRKRFPSIPRRVSGYNLDELLPERPMNIARALVGSEGTCVIILEATVNLVPALPMRTLVVLGFDTAEDAADWVPEGLKFKPIALEGMDDTFIDDMRKKGMHPEHLEQLPPGRAWLFIEFGANSQEEADRQAQRLIDDVKTKPKAPPAKLVDSKELEAALWHLREEGLGATAKVPGEPENHEGWEDTAVHPNDVGHYLRDFQKLLDKYGYEGALYGHFGDGCIHNRLNFDLATKAGIEKYKRFVQEGADLVVSYNGSLSGEHGDGQARGELLRRMYGDDIIQAFAEFKEIWDPDWMLNPGKVIAPYRLTENLLEGGHFEPAEPKTHFRFPDDKYSFLQASLRCVGAGVCRRKEGGTMCPSYMATLEEKHSTRGRARLLFEMLQGEAVKGGWKDEGVKEALDLCLACKGCKGDCPVQVDMATYKAEFLSHYYEGRMRPRHAYAFGLIHVWARLASWAPELVNVAMAIPGVNRVAKKLVGMEPSRKAPKFASYTFKEWFKAREAERRKRAWQSLTVDYEVMSADTAGESAIHGSRFTVDGSPGAPRQATVILWPDTFNDHFHPTTAQAAVEVLEHAGFEVTVPMHDMCCGRPLYDYGMLDTAKRWLKHILVTLEKDIEAGTPIVVLEPSCASVFRDELVNLFPHDLNAQRLSKQVFLLPEFLAEHAPDYQPPKLHRKAVVHGHCHQKSIWKGNAEEKLLKSIGCSFNPLDSGCCGMAGAFGFEEGQHHQVSVALGERKLLPEVRKADPETLIVADGFSCREQVRQGSNREALHVAQVLQMAIRESEAPPRKLPEQRYLKGRAPKEVIVKRGLVYGVLAAAVGTTLWILANRKRS